MTRARLHGSVVTGLLTAGVVISVAALTMSCGSSDPATPSAPSPSGINSDTNLYQLITVTDPFRGYTVFPSAAEVTSGTLNGSSAHQPLVRVSINAKALSALQNGMLPSGAKFPDTSAIVKDVRSSSGVTMEYTVIYKDAANPLAGNGWLWAAFKPDGSVSYSIRDRGAECASCHSREQGPQHDSVRTFERQR